MTRRGLAFNEIVPLLPRPFFIPLLVGIAQAFAAGGALILGMVVGERIAGEIAVSIDSGYAIIVLTAMVFCFVGSFTIWVPYHVFRGRLERRRGERELRRLGPPR